MKTKTLLLIALALLIVFMLASQAQAIIRPPFPRKAAPPYRGEWIEITIDKK